MSRITYGYVYVITTNLYEKDNIYKIGCTKNLEKRMKDINSTRILSDQFILKYKWKTIHYYTLENKAHNLFKEYRENNEFFRLPLEKIISGICQINENEMKFQNNYNHLIEFAEENELRWDNKNKIFTIKNKKIDIMDVLKSILIINDRYNIYKYISIKYYKELIFFLKSRYSLSNFN